MMDYENMVDLVAYDIWAAKTDGEFILFPLEYAMEFADNRFSAILGDSMIEQIAEDAAELYKERFCAERDDEIQQTINDAIKMRF